MKTEKENSVKKEMFVTILEDEIPQTKGCDNHPGVRRDAAFCCQTGCDR